MAPTTHLGAATPVSLSGDDTGDPGGDMSPFTPNDDEAEPDSATDDDAEAGDDAENAEPGVPGTAMGPKPSERSLTGPYPGQRRSHAVRWIPFAFEPATRRTTLPDPSRTTSHTFGASSRSSAT